MVNYYLADTYMALMAAIHGKFEVLPIFYQATEAGPSINESDLRYMCSPFKLATDSRYEVGVAATKRAAVQFLMKRDQCSEESAQFFVDGALALYWLQDKKIKDLRDRLRGEWEALLNKAVRKQKFKSQKTRSTTTSGKGTSSSSVKHFLQRRCCRLSTLDQNRSNNRYVAP